MIVKVVILNWNGRAHLEHYLLSVVANTTVSVVVADNGSTDDSVEFLKNNYPQIELICLDCNYGYAEGYNRALSMVEADAFVLLNSDVETPQGWLTPLVDLMKSDSSIWAVSPKMLSYSDKGSFEYAGAAGGFIDALGYPFCRGRILGNIEKDYGQYDDIHEVFWTSGACMLVRADIFFKLGGFDGDFFAHMEEIDFCWRVHLAGGKVIVNPQSYVYHLGGGTLPNNSPNKLYLNYRNNLAMLYKNLCGKTLYGILFARMLLDGMSAIVFLLQGKSEFFRVVLRAHCDFHKAVKELKRKRHIVQSMRVVNRVSCIFRGSVVLRYMLGFKTFSQVMKHSLGYLPPK